jgi:hypothetical protein
LMLLLLPLLVRAELHLVCMEGSKVFSGFSILESGLK